MILSTKSSLTMTTCLIWNGSLHKEELANTDVIPQDVQGHPLALLEDLERNYNDPSLASSDSAFRSVKGPSLYIKVLWLEEESDFTGKLWWGRQTLPSWLSLRETRFWQKGDLWWQEHLKWMCNSHTIKDIPVTDAAQSLIPDWNSPNNTKTHFN